MITHDIGNGFWGIEKAYKVPFHFRTPVHENEHPFRVSRAHGFCIIPGKALLVGIWQPGVLTPEKHLLEAIRGRLIGTEDIPQLA
jgi:hypothetical protein